MPLKRIILLSIIFTLARATGAQVSQQQLNDQLWEASRKGDVATVRALLDKGVDVNTKFRYGATALSYAADKGHFEVVKLLLERGAEVNIRDTFYNSTPLQWALFKNHTPIIKALIEKGAEGVEEVLMTGARSGNPELVGVALARGGLKPEVLSGALAASAGDEKKAEITEMLKRAGALPPPEIAAETLQSYVGKYKSEQGLEISVTFKDGKLFAAPAGQNSLPLRAVDKTTFKPTEFDGLTVSFNVEGSKVIGFSLVRGANTTVLKKVEP